MITKDRYRITYFSKADLSSEHNLTIAEPIIRSFNNAKDYDLNDIIELYQIKLYLDNDIYLSTWSKVDITQFKDIVKKIWDAVRRYWLKINSDNLIELFKTIEVGYQPAFWNLIEKNETYKNISKSSFKELLSNEQLWIREILHQKNLVGYYSNTLKEYLLSNNESAELLLSEFEEQHDRDYQKLYFPSCLTNEDKDRIILNYLNNQDANINYIRLIVNSKDSSLKLSPHTRLKAMKIEKELNNEILENGSTVIVGNSITLSPDQEEPFKVTWENNIQNIIYSKKWLDKQNDDISLMQNFSLLFNYIDIFGCITLICKNKELDIFEKIMMRSKNAYLNGMIFTRKSNLSHLQIFLYSHYLQQINKSVEGILINFIKACFIEIFGIQNLRIKFPSNNTSYLEKIRLIIPEMESVLKQYKLYVENSTIDHDLLQFSSKPISFKEIPSLINMKYVYGKGKEFKKLEYYFFSDQSSLFYVEPFKNKYRNLYSLILRENVNLNSFKSFQRNIIDNLISEEYLFVDTNGFVRIKKMIELFIIGKISIDEVVSYWHFSKSIRDVINEMETKGLVYFKSTLISESEQSYFNYYLNKSEFTNGLDLRNKYVHGTNSDSEEEHKNDYFILLKLLVLIILKIEDDLLLAHSQRSL